MSHEPDQGNEVLPVPQQNAVGRIHEVTKNSKEVI